MRTRGKVRTTVGDNGDDDDDDDDEHSALSFNVVTTTGGDKTVEDLPSRHRAAKMCTYQGVKVLEVEGT